MIRVIHKFRSIGSKIVAGQEDPSPVTLHMNLLHNKYKHTPISLELCAVTRGDWCPKFWSNLLVSLANDQLDAHILIDLLRSSTCTCFEQYFAHPQEVKLQSSSFSTYAPVGHLLRVTIPDAVLIQFDLLRMSKILLETCTCRGS